MVGTAYLLGCHHMHVRTDACLQMAGRQLLSLFVSARHAHAHMMLGSCMPTDGEAVASLTLQCSPCTCMHDVQLVGYSVLTHVYT